ncbi:MAG: PP2C family protein-serine/threonine phosphatase [Phycisphaerales bacterium]
MTDDGRATFTTEFGQEFDAERERWLRRRFLWYTGIIGGFSLLNTIGAPIGYAVAVGERGTPEGLGAATVISVGVGVVITALYGSAFAFAWRRALRQEQLVSAVTLLIVGYGVTQLMGALVMARMAPALVAASKLSIGGGWVLGVFMSHLLACLFLPLTPREAIRPLIPLLAINAAMTLLSGEGLIEKLITIALSPLIGVPGAAICWWRHSRFRDRFAQRMIKGRYLEMRRELVDARRIHEALFPPPVREGPLLFSYVYEPMRQIGGDYLHLSFPPASGDAPGAMNLVIVDVTGHGIPAALTVNRLHGELERIFAEQPQVGPGEVLRLLNSYVHLTLAGHSVYVTALCLRIDPAADEVRYASGGHPPAFLRGVDGTLEQLASTAFVLGACPGEDFRSDQRAIRFGPGDTIIAYTDGAIEARDRAGRYFGVRGLQRTLAMATPPRDGRGWAPIVTRAVDQHRFGPIADDTLVVEVHRPVGTAAPKSAPVRAVAGAGA